MPPCPKREMLGIPESSSVFDLETGFLCAFSPPLQRLPLPLYEPWEALVDDLQRLTLTGQIRDFVRQVGPLACVEEPSVMGGSRLLDRFGLT